VRWHVAAGAAAVMMTGALSGAPAAGAQGFGCDASALRGTVLGGTPVEPVTANRGQASCRTVNATAPFGVPLLLGASSLVADTLFNGPANRVDQQVATATGAVGNLRIGALPYLPIALPAPPELPGPLSVPGVGTVDLRPALQALLPNGGLPTADLVSTRALSAQATARCAGGKPRLAGTSEVTGLSVLGQELPVGQVVDQALTLIGGATIDPSNADLTKIPLPLGISLDLPGVRSALQGVLDGLPDIEIPPVLAHVRVTPGAQSNDGTRLVQQALNVNVSALGQTLADLVLGEARVSAAGVNCSPAAARTAAQLQCTHRRLVLADVVRRNGRVRLVGAADRRLIGRRVNINFTATGRRVATAVVKRDGSFAATSRLQAKAFRGSNRERFQAVLGREKSLDLKLYRRMRVDATHASRGKVTIAGRVLPPLAHPARAIEVRRRVSCNREAVVARVHPDRSGRFRVTVAAPPKQLAAVYRLKTRVRKHARNPKTYETFTLPRAVALG
jgi:hypothetical protein